MGASYCSAADLAAGYARQDLDPVSVTEAALEAARTAQSAYNAVSALDERCLVAAEESRKRFATGAERGPLDGVPLTVKDSFRCEGLPRWHGSAVHDGVPPSRVDSAPVQRLREAGAIIIAKTAMPDFGMLASGISSQFGVIGNPWDTSLTPGGSSAGAGATLAAGVTPIAMGTDIAGSVRLPAAHCGVAAIKPTQGRIAYAPASMSRSAGPMARCASDLVALLEVVGRPDSSDPWCLPGRFTAATWGVDRFRGMRVALLTDTGYGLPVDGEALDVATKAARQLASWGAVIRELRLDLTDSDYEALDVSFKLGALAEADSAPDARGERLLDVVKTWCETARPTSARDAALAALTVGEARDRVIAATADYDIILSPVMPVPTFPADHVGPVAGVPPLYHCNFTAWFNQTGQPAASICGGRTATTGMPIGIQIAGRRFCDADVLRVAVLLEEALAVDLPWPGLYDEIVGDVMTKMTMSPDDPLAGLLPDEFSSIEWAPAQPTVASPSWLGGDSLFFEGRTRGGVPLLVRVLRPAATIRVDCTAMFAAMEAAGSAGLAPAVLFHDASHGVCVQEKLDDHWQVATLYRLLDPTVWRASLRVRREFRDLALRLPAVSVFDQIESLLAYVGDNAVEIPPVAHDVVAAVEEARACVRGGPEPLPCHGDGAVSNVMLRGSEARLVGWTQAGCMDPLEEVGSVITELAPFVTDAATVFEAAWGDRDPVALARARLYGLADDVRWGLIGSCARAVQPDSPIEYQRYGHWRLFKARFAVATGQVAGWMKEAS